MSEKEASFDTSNSIGQNFVPSNSVNSSLSKQIPKSNSHETQVSHYNEETIHKTILVGDSGVGKTSVLVQFDQGKFQSGSFSATVGIGFTVRKFFYPPTLFDNQQNMTGQEDYDCTFKIMLIGDSGVGKTCLLVRFKDDTFLTCNFIATVGIDFKNKIVTIENKKCKLQIWDTAGQERFRSVTHAYYRDAQALLLLYDVTSQSSFDNIRAWLSEIRQYADEDVIIMLLGNKVDKPNRIITKEQGEKLAKQFEVSFMETSAKTGQNVELAFMAVAKALIAKQMNIAANHNGSKFNLNEYIETNREQKTWCCNVSS